MNGNKTQTPRVRFVLPQLSGGKKKRERRVVKNEHSALSSSFGVSPTGLSCPPRAAATGIEQAASSPTQLGGTLHDPDLQSKFSD